MVSKVEVEQYQRMTNYLLELFRKKGVQHTEIQGSLRAYLRGLKEDFGSATVPERLISATIKDLEILEMKYTGDYYEGMNKRKLDKTKLYRYRHEIRQKVQEIDGALNFLKILI